MKKEEISQLQVTSRTAEFISALNLLEQTKEQFLQALKTLYGEEMGDQFFMTHSGSFDVVRDSISEFLTNSIVWSLSDRELQKTI